MGRESGGARDADDDALPPDAATVQELLASMGVTDYEPRVVPQLLNFVYRHVADILLDAEVYRQRLSQPGGEISLEDLLLAVQARESHGFVQPPAQSVVAELAARLNRQALPELSEKPGLQIPVNSLMGPGYQLGVPAEAALPAADAPEPTAGGGAGSTRRGGGQQAPQIPVRLAQAGGGKAAEEEWLDAS